MFDEVQKWEIRQSKLTVKVRECKVEKTCAACGGPLWPGEDEAPVKGAALHPHCAEDLDVTVNW